MVITAANYVKLEPGIPKRIRVSDHIWKDVEKKDPLTGWVQPWHTLILRVVEEDGEKVDKSFSIPQEKLYRVFEPYLDTFAYRHRLITITQHGSGFATEFEVEIK